jgi:hypothetical protein
MKRVVMGPAAPARPDRLPARRLSLALGAFLLLLPGCGARTPVIAGPDGRPAPEAASATQRVILPFAFYSPETRLGVGALFAFYRRLATGVPESGLENSFTVTARRQFAADLSSRMHLEGGRRAEVSARAHHFPDQFFGVGPGTADEAEEHYTSRMFRAEARHEWEVRPGIRIGPQGRFLWERVLDPDEEGVLAEGALPGAEGGRWLGLGAVANRDTRDAVLLPRRGAIVELSVLHHAKALGSTTGFRRGIVDARQYLPLGDRSSLALRGYLEVAGGEVPVLMLPALGGKELMRGYLEGRLRDRTAAVVQGEARFPLIGRLGGTAFAEAGRVGPRVGALQAGRPEFSAGGGLRFRITDEGVRIRLDYAVGRRGSGLYLTLGEAF